MTVDYEKIENTCFAKAHAMLQSGLSRGLDLFDLTELLIKVELEKIEKQRVADSLIDYNDEIVSIEEVGELETVDISVTGDQLFFCNDILTKNSMGITHTADAIFALITSEELDNLGQVMIKQLKNRWGDINYYRRFVVGIDRSKMKLFNLEDNAQKNVTSEASTPQDTTATFDKSAFAEHWSSDGKPSRRGGKKPLFNTGDDIS